MRKFVIPFLVLALVSGCASGPDRESIEKTVDQDLKKAQDTVRAYREAIRKPRAEVTPIEGNWVNTDPVPYHSPLPAVFSRAVTLVVASPEYATVLFNRASRLIHLPVRVEQDLFLKSTSLNTTQPVPGTDSSGLALPTQTALPTGNRVIPKITVSYRGDARGLLDRLAASVGAQWRYDRKLNEVVFYRYITRAFAISAQPGSTRTNATVAVQNTSQNSGQSRNEDTATGDYSLWDSLEESIKAMLSDEGSYAVDESAGFVMVRDLPHVVTQIDKYIRRLNASLEQGVILDIKVYSVSVEDTDSTNIAWNALFDDGVLGAALSTPRTAIANPSFLKLNIPSTSNNSLAGSEWFLERLSKLGKTSLVTSGVLVSVNNKPSPISFGETIYYVANTGVTNTVNVGSTTSVQQESVDVGFSASLLPRVLANGSDMILRVSIILSRLSSLEPVTVNGVFLERPRIERRQLSPEILIRSGQSLLIAGLSFSTDSAQRSGILDRDAWMLGGGRELSLLRNQLVILITPRVYRPGDLNSLSSNVAGNLADTDDAR